MFRFFITCLVRPVTSSQWSVAAAVFVVLAIVGGLTMIGVGYFFASDHAELSAALATLGIKTMVGAGLIGIVGIAVLNVLLDR